jgi:hypothetical protein
MNVDRLGEIRERADKASAGPWRANEYQPASVWQTPPGIETLAIDLIASVPGTNRIADAVFIAAARADVPWLLAEVERLQRIEQAARALMSYEYELDIHDTDFAAALRAALAVEPA